MTRMILHSRIGPDGTLQLTVPVGQANANQDVIVTIDGASPRSDDRKSWDDFLASIEGKWQGDFERPPQGDYEQREELQ